MTWFNSTTLILDDTDPSILYSPSSGWLRGQTDPSLDNYNNTLTLAVEPGFSASFTFTGVAVEVFGAVWTANFQPFSTYSIDGVEVGSFQAPAVTTDTPRVQFFSSPTLPEGEHTLTIFASSFDTEYLVDYILYTPSAAASKRGLVDSDITDMPASLQRTSANTFSGGLLSGSICMLLMCMLYLGLRSWRNGRKSRSAKTAWVDVAAGNGIDGSVALQAPYGRAVNMLEKQSLV